MSRFTDEHEKGVNAFIKSLEHKQLSCSGCEFEASVLHDEWDTHVETNPKTGHIQYRLTCPDCRTEEVVDIDI
ncbi:hypothetical protein [Natrinema gelatinilyticum]|uniref:hypothetical protein n=1 Tax=Natrinema gelatinilyticum TaxID=2961571 RepID=UPI0020C36653|nr:hypothetical protein [Natrinema gelatinilyticum]